MVMRCRWRARGLTAPGYHDGARGRDYCVIRNPHKVSCTHIADGALGIIGHGEKTWYATGELQRDEL